MNVEQTTARLTDTSDTHISDSWLRLSRILWSTCLLLGVGLFVGGLPTYFASLHQVISSVNLNDLGAQLTPQDVKALHAVSLSLDVYAWVTLSIYLLLLLVYVLVGTVLFWRAASNRVALLASFSLILFPLALGGQIVDLLPPVWTIPTECARFIGSACLGLFFYVFPGGRFVPRFTRWLAVAWVVYWAWEIFFPALPNIPPFSWLALLILLGLLASQLMLQIYRYRRMSTPTERQQTKWVVFGIVISFGAIFLAQAVLIVVLPLLLPVDPLITSGGQTLTILLLLLFPLSIGFAVLRYHLWDIDHIINRTLVYGLLTACVIGLYVLIVGGLSTAFQIQGNLVISLGATALIAVLFQPLRNWLQRSINRLMYGERDDPYRILSRLGQRLEGTLAPEQVLPTIVQTTAQALKLPYVAVTLKQDDALVMAASSGTATTDLVHLPLLYQGEHVGELLLAARAPGEALSSADRRLLTDLARQAGIAVYTVRLTTDLQRLARELQHSRTELVTTREEERRRLRRDLHDGLGSVLTSLNLRAGAIHMLLGRDSAAAEVLVVEQQSAIRSAIADIRRLVYDLRPPSLDELGLLDAIRERAAHYGLPAERSDQQERLFGLSVEVLAPDDVPALSAALEVATYRIVQEALSNVARHADARTCVIRLALSEGVLQVEITDDGIGLPPAHRGGVGLLSMHERAAELDGTCEIVPAPGGGTRVRARLPVLTEA